MPDDHLWFSLYGCDESQDISDQWMAAKVVSAATNQTAAEQWTVELDFEVSVNDSLDPATVTVNQALGAPPYCMEWPSECEIYVEPQTFSLSYVVDLSGSWPTASLSESPDTIDTLGIVVVGVCGYDPLTIIEVVETRPEYWYMAKILASLQDANLTLAVEEALAASCDKGLPWVPLVDTADADSDTDTDTDSDTDTDTDTDNGHTGITDTYTVGDTYWVVPTGLWPETGDTGVAIPQ
jgi:hypothetical protein